MDYERRRQRAADAMTENRLDAVAITHLPNIRYLCGFTGSAGVLVGTPGKWAFFTDGRYTAQARAEVDGARVVIARGAPLAEAAKWLGRAGVKRIGIEAEHLPVALRSALKAMLPNTVRLRETQGLIEWLRVIKDPEEVDLIRDAVNLGATLLESALAAIRPGVSETAVAAEIEYAARKAGALGMSFDTIVASGKRSALPHGKASPAPIPTNGFVLMDFGVILAGYCSDMTRTVHVGRVGAKARSIYDAVHEAQLTAISSVRAGQTAAAIDAAARRVLKKAGLGSYFTHSTGHGVGLEIHEPPRIGRSGSDLLESGMVITIEPGAYVPEVGGVRIEDVVLVTESGCEVLTPARKKLLIL